MTASLDALRPTVASRVNARAEEVLELAGALVRERSVLGAESGALAIVDSTLRSIGCAVEHVEPNAEECLRDPHGGYPALPYEGRACVVGRLEGAGGGRSLHLSGHVDVTPVESEERWIHDPWAGEVSDGRLWGRGSGDMKGGLAAYLIAAGVAAELELAGDLVISAVIEEECGGNGMRAVLAAGHGGAATLIGEPTDHRLHHAGVGVVWAQLAASGPAKHAQYASGERSTIERLYPVIEALRSLERRVNDDAEPSVFTAAYKHPYNVTIGEMRAGSWPSSTPAEAVLRVRVGFGPELAPAKAQELVAEVVHDADPDVEVLFEGFRAPAYSHDPDDSIGQVLSECHTEVLGEIPGRKVSLGTTDARSVPGPCLCYGPVAGNVHGIDEWVSVDSLRDTALVVALVAARWCGDATDSTEGGDA